MNCSGVNSANQEQGFPEQPCLDGSKEIPQLLSVKGTVDESQQVLGQLLT